MAETYLSASFGFTCTSAEMALLEEAFQAAAALNAECEPGEPTPELLAALPPTDQTDRWSGLLDLFCDPAFPDFGADLSGGNTLEAPAVCDVRIAGMIDFQPEPIGKLIHRCCRDTLKQGPIGFEWAETCSKPRIGEFGGGWCAIHADRVEMQLTREGLAEALRTEIPKAAALARFYGIWGDLPGHPAEDWRYEVANGDTRLGYWDWVVNRQEVAEILASTPFPD